MSEQHHSFQEQVAALRRELRELEDRRP